LRGEERIVGCRLRSSGASCARTPETAVASDEEVRLGGFDKRTELLDVEDGVGEIVSVLDRKQSLLAATAELLFFLGEGLNDLITDLLRGFIFELDDHFAGLVSLRDWLWCRCLFRRSGRIGSRGSRRVDRRVNETENQNESDDEAKRAINSNAYH